MELLSAIKKPAALQYLGEIVEMVSACARGQGFSDEAISDIELATEEILVNICNYSYPGVPGDVEVECKLDSGKLIIQFIDSGLPFDMSTLPDPDITAEIEDRKIGGLGIFFVKKLMDDVRYQRKDNFNILELVIRKRSVNSRPGIDK